MADFMQSLSDNILPSLIPLLKWGMVFFGIVIVTVALAILIINLKKRKWKVEIHEMKSDGRLHNVGEDTLQELKIEAGRKTVYWLKKAKCEAIPPPDETIDRNRGKEKVHYLRISRDYIPMIKRIKTDYNNIEVKKKVIAIHDKILYKIRDIHTSFFDSEPVRNQFVYIPVNKTLTANMTFEPIDYDVSMMAMNEIHNADDFYASKYEFWKKYGAIIVFAITIVFLIILIVLTYEYMGKVVGNIMGKVTENSNLLNGIVDKLAGGKPPG
jgi:hypothetical protein